MAGTQPPLRTILYIVSFRRLEADPKYDGTIEAWFYGSGGGLSTGDIGFQAKRALAHVMSMMRMATNTAALAVSLAFLASG